MLVRQQILEHDHSHSIMLHVMLYKAVLTFESFGEILKCYHSNGSY